MSEATQQRPEPTRRPEPNRAAPQGRRARIRQWLRRAAGADGHERHTAALIGKSALAATAAWVVAHDCLGAQSPAFAPFSAVVIMQVTVYQSVVQALRYVGAVAAGVALQGALGFLAGPDVLTFVLVALVAMAIGRWRRLGSQGSQVTTAAFFAFSTYVSASGNAERLGQLGQIVLLVLIGCGIGVVVNVTVLPPMRYRSAEHGIHTLSHSLCDLVSDISPALREGETDEERTRHWRQRAEHLPALVDQAQSSVNVARESAYYNPRRVLRRHGRHTTFSGYQEVVDALARVTHQVTSLVRSLDQWHDGERGATYGEFLRHYGDFLSSLAHITALFSRIDEDHLTDQARELCSAAGTAQERHSRLVGHSERSALPVGDLSQPYGILLVEATRLMDEFQYTCDVLQHEVEHERTSGCP
ncbi:aromatic acid exporter family member 1 [Streptomyces sp. Amel2xB2]|uniref:FUSC family protein n=1 Tax=Streptomyces sp. Amel2xB2 TaxID=1305829 RepID=UPI000DBFCF07|nr:aromatic acid exporter family protein [Streptomyces sp. Amel2xB2]RAJ67130.1 aromatic acid exporter family member 1 [Streptomyces sp. Amel2xB2]